jgi:aldose 1-epimerase
MPAKSRWGGKHDCAERPPERAAAPIVGWDLTLRRANIRQPRRIGSTTLDHAFTDLVRDQDGLARVELQDPDQGTWVSIWVDGSYPYLMFFSGDPLPDVRRRSLAVEPMTCPPNAFRTGDALIVLEPGSSFTSTWGIACGRTHC